MGNAIHKRLPPDTSYVVSVKTGNRTGAGTDANVFIILVNANGDSSRIFKLDVKLRNDFESGNVDDFPIQQLDNFGAIREIQIWRDTYGLFDDWYVDWIKVKSLQTEVDHVFPVNRWVPDNKRLSLLEFDTCLPKNAPYPKVRRDEIEENCKKYEYDLREEGLFPQLKELPKDEAFSSSGKWDLRKKRRYAAAQIRVKNLKSSPWQTPEGILGEFSGSFLRKPLLTEMWRSDIEFGRQRLSHCNPLMIKRCRSHPIRPAVTDPMLQPLLNGLTIADAIAERRLYVVDYAVMDGIECNAGRSMVAPAALFFVNKENDLKPIAIQLQKVRSAENPVFLPSDPEYTWILAKMWFNLADANYHQIVAHLAFTHFLIEPIVVACYRCLSPSHPIFRLLAPHFAFLFPINHLGLEVLLAQGGLIDSSYQLGMKGMLDLIRRIRKQWRMDVDGKFPRDIEERGVDDTSALQFYPYRDDGLLLHQAIYSFVSEVVDGHYTSSKMLTKDQEIQDFARTLATPASDGGAGINGVPGRGKLESKKELKDLLTSIIFTCTVKHSAVNYSQYDDYAYPFNYPTMIKGEPPRDKTQKSIQDIMNTVPSRKMCMENMIITRLLSEKVGNSIGQAESEFLFDPVGKQAVENFRTQLKKIEGIIDSRNRDRKAPYLALHPKNVTHSICT